VRDYETLRNAYTDFCNADMRKQLQCLVNCAEINIPTGLVGSGVEEWEAVIGTNLTGVYLSCKAAAELLATGGSIVNVSSAQAHLGGRSPHYAASKTGIEGMPKSIVNCVAPGASATGMAHAWDDKTATRLASAALLDRISQPSEFRTQYFFFCLIRHLS
jgi:NAD(P)-dependent dehydrogenase (short-subunit alcohol dehydrogenase family)